MNIKLFTNYKLDTTILHNNTEYVKAGNFTEDKAHTLYRCLTLHNRIISAFETFYDYTETDSQRDTNTDIVEAVNWYLYNLLNYEQVNRFTISVITFADEINFRKLSTNMQKIIIGVLFDEFIKFYKIDY